MKLVTYSFICPLGRVERLGAIVGRYILDLHFSLIKILVEDDEPRAYEIARAELPDNMLEFLTAGPSAMDLARDVIMVMKQSGWMKPSMRGPNEERLVWRPHEVRLKAPLPNPVSLRDFLAFEQHVKTGYQRRNQEFPALWYELPVYYKGNPLTIIGPDEPVFWPSYTEKFDYELELAAVIGKAGMNIPVEKAHEHIAGYMIMNDFSARDIQMQEMSLRLGPAKGKDFGTAFGPWLVTPDEVGDVRNLTMTATINDEEWSRGHSGDSHWTFEQMIAHVSKSEPLVPGEIIGSGTVGTGCGYELDRWVQPGDSMELSITNLGTLRNQVIKPE